MKTIQTLACHSTAQLSVEVYAAADPGRLREAVDKVAGHIRDISARSACCTGVAWLAAGAEGMNVSPDKPEPLRNITLVGPAEHR